MKENRIGFCRQYLPSCIRREGRFGDGLALDTAAGNTGDDLLGHEDVQQEGGQEHDDNGSEHDPPEDLGGRAAVDLRSLLEAAGQVRKEVQQENGGVGHIDADVQEQQNQTVLDAVVHQMQLCDDAEQGQHDHGHGNAHGSHEAGLDGGVADELEAAEDIGAGCADDDQQHAGDQGVDQGVAEDDGNILAAPGLCEVLEMQTGGELAHFTGEDLGPAGNPNACEQRHHNDERHSGQNHFLVVHTFSLVSDFVPRYQSSNYNSRPQQHHPHI